MKPVGVGVGILVVEIYLKDFMFLNEKIPPDRNHEGRGYVGLGVVDKIILDPSCSGSGLPSHCDPYSISNDVTSRVAKLAKFQKIMLLHAASAFPSVQSICYSTCSNYVEEDEEVIAAILCELDGRSTGLDSESPFIPVAAVPWWPSTPAPEALKFEWSWKCVRSSYDTHRCRGFFLAKLERNKKLTSYNI